MTMFGVLSWRKITYYHPGYIQLSVPDVMKCEIEASESRKLLTIILQYHRKKGRRVEG